ncbi:hypothetical protein JYT19_00970 [Sulfobacillus acidophilus]|uniref:PorV/PorQ family protein n=1 Tax=Sulfobacillus acidophilus TaxID=53633 RepID=A0ABS3AXC1_9FIRM|nr:hypothetical protein [Sulfobacillus acidophilus]
MIKANTLFKIRWQIFLFFLAMLILANNKVQAQGLSEGTPLGVRAQAMGGAYRSAALGSDVLYYNPAGLLIDNRYELDFDYFYLAKNKQNLLGASLVDSTTSTLAAGIDYHLTITKTNEKTEFFHQWLIALAYPLVQDALLTGLSFKYKSNNKFNLDFGTLFILPFGISLAAVGYDLLPSQTDFFLVGFGASFSGRKLFTKENIFDSLTIAVDYMLQPKILDFGFEYIIAKTLPLRAGLGMDFKKDEKTISFGTGLASPTLGLDLLYQKNLNLADADVYAVALKLIF